jgi:hypothetical protein
LFGAARRRLRRQHGRSKTRLPQAPAVFSADNARGFAQSVAAVNVAEMLEHPLSKAEIGYVREAEIE